MLVDPSWFGSDPLTEREIRMLTGARSASTESALERLESLLCSYPALAPSNTRKLLGQPLDPRLVAGAR